jgi:leucyl-tRNA synthetase
METKYNYTSIEKKWRGKWLKEKTFSTPAPQKPEFEFDQPKCYVLDMFPYPSGSGLHIGHPKGYIATDIYSRFKKMQGFNVLHPMGFDSFGLPAEQYAIEHNVHPSTITEENIDSIRSQLQYLGLGYDWDREIATSRPDYYAWTQWIFSQLYESFYDSEHIWQDVNGKEIIGKALPIKHLLDDFSNGDRKISEEECINLDIPLKSKWIDLTLPEQQNLLNSYRLAYQDEIIVNWCPGLGTVLANEEVTSEGKSERGDFPVFKRPLRQWIMRITAYADRLLGDLDRDLAQGQDRPSFQLDWPPAIKSMQKNWIGRSEGTNVLFTVLKPNSSEVHSNLNVFTTRPDTLFGVTFMVLSPEHPMVKLDSETNNVPESWPENTPENWKGDGKDEHVQKTLSRYAEHTNTSSLNIENREKTGIFTGIYALNPVNNDKIPIFVSDYVSMDYGEGAIMAVPAHDDRDFEFAQKFQLPVIKVVSPTENDSPEDKCFAGRGVSINSPSKGNNAYSITGLDTESAIKKITNSLEEYGIGNSTVNYKLRDWIFSRQRYWGEPFPLVSHPDGYSISIDPPIVLPPMEDFRPTTSDDPNQPVQPPLHRAGPEWWKTELTDGVEGIREMNVMPQWAGSCWYYLRFIDPLNENRFCDAKAESYFMPVDLYVGGAEHAVLHLLYARFWHKVLYDLGYVSTPEPFKKLFNQGMITADAFQDERGVYVDIREVELRDGEGYSKTGEKLIKTTGKMGKRYKNGLPPEEIGAEYGVDTLRLYEMYMGPLEASTPWSMEGIRGMQRFLQRVWRNFFNDAGKSKIGGEATEDQLRTMNKSTERVCDHIENLRFNTAIASLIEWNNELVAINTIPQTVASVFLRLLNPFAPHITEEINSRWDDGFETGLSSAPWPEADEKYLTDELITLPIQVNGKVRGKISISPDISEEDLRQKVLNMENVTKYINNPEQIKRFILVPGRIVNIVC